MRSILTQFTQFTQFNPFTRLWCWPLVLGLLSATGLLSALVSEGWGDVWSWLALGVPVLAMAWFAWPRRGQPSR